MVTSQVPNRKVKVIQPSQFASLAVILASLWLVGGYISYYASSSHLPLPTYWSQLLHPVTAYSATDASYNGQIVAIGKNRGVLAPKDSEEFFLFGHYFSLMAGTYTVAIDGVPFDTSHSGAIHGEIAANDGQKLLGTFDIPNGQLPYTTTLVMRSGNRAEVRLRNLGSTTPVVYSVSLTRTAINWRLLARDTARDIAYSLPAALHVRIYP